MKIPRTGVQTQVAEKPLEPTQSVAAAVEPYKAQAQLLGKTQEFVTTLLEKRYQADAISQVNKTESDFSKFSTDLQNQLSLKYTGANPKGMLEEYTKQTSEYRQKLMEGVDNQLARSNLSSSLEKQHRSDLEDVGNLSNKLNAYYQVDTFKEEQDSAIQSAATLGSFDKSNEAVIKGHERITQATGTLFSPLEATKLKKDLSNSPQLLTENLIAAGDINSLEIMKGVVEGKNPKYKAMYDTLDAETAVRLQSKLTNAIELKKEVDTRELYTTVQNVSKAISEGVVAPTDSRVKEVEVKIALQPDSPEKKKMQVFLQQNKIVAEATLNLADTPISAWTTEKDVSAVASQFADKNFTAEAFTASVKEGINQAQSKALVEFSKNNSDFFYSRSPDVKFAAANAFSSKEGYLAYKNLVDTRTAKLTGDPKSKANSYSNALFEQKGKEIESYVNTRNYDLANEELIKIEAAAGSDSKQLLEDMKVDKKVATTLLVDKRYRPELLALVHNKASYDDKTMTSYNADLALNKEDPAYTAFQNQAVSPDDQEDAQQLAEYATLYQRQHPDISDPWKIVTENHAIVNPGNGQNIAIPKDKAGSSEDLELFMQSTTVYADKDVLGTLGIVPSGTVSGATVNDLQANTTWMYSPKHNMLKMVYLGTKEGVVDSKGNPINVTIETANKIASKFRNKETQKRMMADKALTSPRNYPIGL